MKKRNHPYKVGDPKIDPLVEELARVCSSGDHEELVKEILTTVVKLALEHDGFGDFKLINTTLKEMRHALRIFSPYRNIRKAAIFGSSRTLAADPCYSMARALSNALSAHGFMVITGAGGGIMEAANQGAGADKSFGININLPLEQKPNIHIKGSPRLMNFKYFFTRKLIFIKESDATVLFPGGFGTLDEGFESLTLFQTGKCMLRPIVLVEPENGHYWKNWLSYIRAELLDTGYISPDDLKLFSLANSVERATEHILEFYRVYHSLRYVKNLTVLRFNRKISSKLLERLNDEYRDILRGGKIEVSPPLKEEIDRDEFLDLPRLALDFNRSNFGRLNEMVRTINQCAAEDDS